MNKIAMILTAVVLAGFVSVKFLDHSSAVPLHHPIDEQTLRERVLNYQCFKQLLNETLASLRNGEITLKEAQTRVRVTAMRFRPEYLADITPVETGTTDDERVARNLLGHLRYLAEFEPDLAPRVRQLELELGDLMGEIRGASSAVKPNR